MRNGYVKTWLSTSRLRVRNPPSSGGSGPGRSEPIGSVRQELLNGHGGDLVSGAKASTKRPDVVLYVNGIALGVLELKRSTVSVSEGIRQNLDNQKKEFIQPFFSTLQWVMAGNDTEALAALGSQLERIVVNPEIEAQPPRIGQLIQLTLAELADAVCSQHIVCRPRRL